MVHGVREGDRPSIHQNRRATLKYGLGRSLDVQAVSTHTVDKDGHHLAVARELKGHEPREALLVVFVHGVRAEGRAERREGLGEGRVGAGELLGEDFKGGFGGFADV